MKEKNRKVPKLRFPGFNDDWEQRKVGDTCKINGRIGFRGYTEKDIITKEAGGVITFSPTNIVDNKLSMDCKNTYITREKYDESPEIMIKNGDVLFVKTGSTLGKSALVTGLEEDASINPQLVAIRVKDGTETFFSNVLTTQNVLKQVAAVRIGGAVPTMTETELKNFTYYEPTSRAEKVKIGDYFRSLDNLITLHQRKLDDMKEYKKGMLQKMFPQKGQSTPEIRFPGFTAPWEQRKLGEILKERVERAQGDEELLSVTIGSGVIRQSDSDKRNTASEDRSNYKVVRKGDVPYNSMRMWQGAVGKSEYDGIVSPAYTVLIPSNEANGKFFMELFKKESTLQIFQRWSQGLTSDTWNLKYPALSSIPFLIPSVEEQTQIAELFEDIDNLITLHQRKIDEMKEFKKGLLQQMFI